MYIRKNISHHILFFKYHNYFLSLFKPLARNSSNQIDNKHFWHTIIYLPKCVLLAVVAAAMLRCEDEPKWPLIKGNIWGAAVKPLLPLLQPGKGGAGRLKGFVRRGGGLGVKAFADKGIESVVISAIKTSYRLN